MKKDLFEFLNQHQEAEDQTSEKISPPELIALCEALRLGQPIVFFENIEETGPSRVIGRMLPIGSGEYMAIFNDGTIMAGTLRDARISQNDWKYFGGLHEEHQIVPDLRRKFGDTLIENSKPENLPELEPYLRAAAELVREAIIRQRAQDESWRRFTSLLGAIREVLNPEQ